MALKSAVTRLPRAQAVLPSRADLTKELHDVLADPAGCLANLRLRNAPFSADSFDTLTALAREHVALNTTASDLRARLTSMTAAVRASIVGASGTKLPKLELPPDARKVKLELQQCVQQQRIVDSKLRPVLESLPNDTSPHTPANSTEHVVSMIGPTELLDYSLPKDFQSHVEYCSENGLVDFAAGSKVSGSGFYFLTHEAALMEIAMIAHAIKVARAHGFVPVSPPDIVREQVAASCGFNPRDQTQTDCFYLEDKEHSAQGAADGDVAPPRRVLAATAEIPLAGMYSGSCIPEAKLPLKMVAFGRAFRAEAKSKARVTRGLFRVHQFSKVELFAITTKEQSEQVFEDILAVQRKIIEDLGILARCVEMPATDLGASAWRKQDTEAWMPGLSRWGEISSASNCTDYQARRLGITLNRGTQKTLEYAHTLNGTAIAIPRTLVAILEQGLLSSTQTSKSGIPIPLCLQDIVGAALIPNLKLT